MTVILLFVAVAAVSFALVILLTRPSRRAQLLQQRLENVSLGSEPSGERPIDILKKVTFSDIPFLDSIFRSYSLTRNLRELLVQANSSWTVGRLIATMLLVFVLAAWISGIWIPILILRLVVALLLAAVPYVIVRFQKAKRFKAFDNALPDAIDLMSRGLRAGHSVSSVIEIVGKEIQDPVGPEFRKAFEQQNFGLPFRDSLEDLARRIPIADLQFVVTAILVQKDSGGNLAEVLDKAAVVIRERLRLKGELAIYTAQGRLTGWILGILPFIMFVLIGLVNPNYTTILIHDELGQKLVLVGLGLMGLGFYIIRKIVDIKV
ncbi:MAG TPA: type II secretion system F family protein [Candidatus Angelobacter sp.]|nr:type II secretion system F family protein [Candidatus Angelobacter sp.]